MSEAALELLQPGRVLVHSLPKSGEAGLNSWVQSSMSAMGQMGGGQVPLNSVLKPRMILFPSKDLEVPPYMLSALSLEFPGLAFALAKRTDADLAAKVQVTSFPKMVILQTTLDEKSMANGQVNLGMQLQHYGGKIHFNAVANMMEKSPLGETRRRQRARRVVREETRAALGVRTRRPPWYLAMDQDKQCPAWPCYRCAMRGATRGSDR